MHTKTDPDTHDGSIDAGLSLLASITPRGVCLTQQEIADACGCSRGYIYLLEKQAIKKIRPELVKRGITKAE